MYQFKVFFLLFFFVSTVLAQNKLELDGQASIYGNYKASNGSSALLLGRYIPTASYVAFSDSSRKFDLEASVNVLGNVSSQLFDNTITNSDIQPYRLWARYSGKQVEFRVGLQKNRFWPFKIGSFPAMV